MEHKVAGSQQQQEGARQLDKLQAIFGRCEPVAKFDKLLRDGNMQKACCQRSQGDQGEEIVYRVLALHARGEIRQRISYTGNDSCPIVQLCAVRLLIAAGLQGVLARSSENSTERKRKL